RSDRRSARRFARCRPLRLHCPYHEPDSRSSTMAAPRRSPPRFVGENLRRKLDVTSAMAWESLVDTHVEQATWFVSLLAEYEPIEESLPRYLREMDIET